MAPSLPPAPDQGLTPPPRRLHTIVQKDSLIRRKAVAIVAMRAQGFTTEEIATELKIKPSSVKQYVYQATKAGFLVNSKGESLLSNPADAVEYELAHKAIRNFSAALDDAPVTTGDGEIKQVSERMWEATKELTKGAIFKQFEQAAAPTAPSLQVLQVKIEMSGSGASDVREGTIGGVPAYVEGETSEE